jgi:hypothetical protein
MAISGMMGQVWYVDDECPTATCAAGWGAPTSGQETCVPDEVTRFTIDDSVQNRKFGHDKSFGWQDVCAGVRSFAINLDAMWKPKVIAGSFDTIAGAGKVLYLVLYPLGADAQSCHEPWAGYAMIERISRTNELERGEPFSYRATLASKGPWTGPENNANWGGFECAGCSGA